MYIHRVLTSNTRNCFLILAYILIFLNKTKYTAVIRIRARRRLLTNLPEAFVSGNFWQICEFFKLIATFSVKKTHFYDKNFRLKIFVLIKCKLSVSLNGSVYFAEIS